MISENILLKTLLPWIAIELIVTMLVFAIYHSFLLDVLCPNYLVYTPSFVISGILLILFPFLLYALHHVKDGLSIQREYTMNLCVVFVMFLLYIANLSFKNLLGSRYVNTFVIVGLLISHGITVVYPLFKVVWQIRMNKGIRSDMDTFKDVLVDPILFRKLKRVNYELLY